MDATTLQRLSDLVLEENKVVTYKWLCIEFGVPSATAKTMLQEFTEANKEKVQPVFLISGEQMGHFQMTIVPENQVEEAKQAFSEVYSTHYYSVQVAVPKDLNTLWTADFALREKLFHEDGSVDEILKGNKYSPIRGHNNQRKAITKVVSAPEPLQKQPSSGGGLPLGGSKTSQPIQRARTEEAPKKKGLPLVGSQGSTNSRGLPLGGTQSSSPRSNTSSSKPKNALKNMFGRAKPKAAKKAVVTEEPESKQVEPEEPEEDETEKVGSRKRLRRIIQDDSDESDNEEDDPLLNDLPEPEPEVEQEPEPEPEAAKANTVESDGEEGKDDEAMDEGARETNKPSIGKMFGTGPSAGGQKRKGKKLVVKEYEDEDGFMVTEEVWEDVEEDNEENADSSPPPAKKMNLTPPAEKKKPSSQASSQSSTKSKKTQGQIMSFFTKQ